MTSSIVARDVSYEDVAPVSDGSGEVLCQGCTKLRKQIISSFNKCKISCGSHKNSS